MSIAQTLFLVAYSSFLDPITTQGSHIVESTTDVRDALRDPSITEIQIGASIAINDDEWGSVVTRIETEVSVVSSESNQNQTTSIYFGEKDGIIAVGSEGKLAFQGLRLPNIIKSRGDALVYMFPPIHVAQGGRIEVRNCNLTLSHNLCAEAPFSESLTLLHVWQFAFAEIDLCGAIHHTERSIFLHGSKDCGFPTMSMRNGEKMPTGVVSLENTFVSCPEDEAHSQGETEYITVQAGTAVDIAYTLIKALDYDKATVTLEVMNDMIIDKQAWPHVLLSANHYSLEIVIQGSPESRPALMLAEANDGPVIYMGSRSKMEILDIVIQTPKIYHKYLHAQPCEGNELENKLEEAVIRPSIMYAQSSDLTLRNVHAIYDMCPDFFSPPTFCERLLKYFQDTPNSTLIASDVTCSPDNAKSVIFNKFEAKIPFQFGEGQLFDVWSFSASNYIVSCKEYGVYTDCPGHSNGSASQLEEEGAAVDRESMDANAAKTGKTWLLPFILLVNMLV